MIEALEDSIVYLLPYDKLMLLTEISWEINMFYRKFWNIPSLFHKLKPTPGGLKLHVNVTTN